MNILILDATDRRKPNHSTAFMAREKKNGTYDILLNSWSTQLGLGGTYPKYGISKDDYYLEFNLFLKKFHEVNTKI